MPIIKRGAAAIDPPFWKYSSLPVNDTYLMTSRETENRTITPFYVKTGQEILCTGVIISAGRILLRPISEGDTWQVFENFTADIARFMVPQPPERVQDTVQFIRRAMTGMERRENLQFVIVDKNSGEFLGCCGLHGHGTPKTPELGIWLKATAHGSGYGQEAIAALISWAEQHLVYDYLVYPVDRKNVPSRKIPEALGGEIFEETICRRQDGGRLDVIIYRIYPQQT
jgi:ribosomal-protein-alanine N-acetyltransferase